MLDWLSSLNMGISSIITYISPGFWENPAWTKVALIPNVISLVFGAFALSFVSWKMLTKYYIEPKKGTEPTWSTNEIIVTSSAIFVLMLMWTPLAGALIGGFVKWFF